MLDSLFGGIFENSESIAVGSFLLCMAVSLVIGAALAFVYSIGAKHSRSFLTTLALLPGVVCVIIMMVNGNVGAGVAVAGAFSLVRFRSLPGTAREIGAIFIAMGAGLMTGMGYLGLAFLFTVILCAATLAAGWIMASGEPELPGKVLHITIPENLDYSGVFDGILEKYTDKAELVNVKTTNMGSLFKLTYHVTMKKDVSEKEMIDELRCRNGNLEIQMSMQETAMPEL